MIETDHHKDETPKVAHGKVPLWIKVMWFGGIVWICTYIWLGLKSSPLTW